MRQRLALAVFVLLTLLLSACGGGGGGGTGFRATPTSLTFNGVQGRNAPAPQSVNMTFSSGDVAYVGAAWVGSQPSWANTPYITGSGRNWQLIVSVWDTSLPPGTYTATLKCGVGKSDGTVLESQDIAITYKVTSLIGVDTTFLAFDYVQGGTVPATASVYVSGASLAWTAQASQPWIKLGTTAGTTPSWLHVSVDPAGLAPGTYDGTVTLTHTDASDTATVAVRLTVSAPGIQPQTALAFSGVNGAPLAAQPINVSLTSGASVTWTATAADPWVVLGKTTGTTPDTLAVSADPSRGPLASGNYASSITLTATAGGTTLTRVVPVTLALAAPTLTVEPSTLVLGGTNGRDFSAKNLQVSLNTGAGSWPVTLTPGKTWMAPAATSAQASATPATVGISPATAGLTGGSYHGTLTVTARVNGDTLTFPVPVDLNLESHRLLVQDTGAAFASMPGLSVLTRTIPVRDNLGLTTSWTAVSDKAWLTVTPSGTTPGSIVLTANPAGLGPDTLDVATITLTSPDSTVEGVERIQAGLWVGASAPAAFLHQSSTGNEIASDPVRPYIYLATGNSSVEVWNIHTNALVTTFSGLGARIIHVAVSADGSKLYASDATNYKITAADLPSGQVRSTWDAGTAEGPHLAYARSNGQGLLLAGNGYVFNAETGASLGRPNPWTSYSYPVAASLQGNQMSLDSGVHSLDYTALNGGQVIMGEARWPNASAWNSADYAFNADGSRFYAAFASPYDFYVFDTAGTGYSLPLVQTLPGAAYPGNVEVAKDGRIFCLSESASPYDFWIYGPDGSQKAARSMYSYGSPYRSSGMRISGDGLRVALLGNEGGWVVLRFATTAP